MKIIKFYLNIASYIAEDENGNQFRLDLDYWENKFKINKKNNKLEDFARKLLKKKHKVNFVHKMVK